MPAGVHLVPPGALLVLAALAGRAGAITICVNPGGTGGCSASIQQAVDVAPRGSEIVIAAGTYNENVVVAGTVLTIRGAGAGATIVDGGGSDRVFDVQGVGARLTLADLTARNGGGVEGAGVRCGSTTRVELSGVTISDCHAPGAANGGGVLVAPGARLTVDGSTIEDNSANQGGAIVGEVCPMVVSGCLGARVVITDSVLRSNTATEGAAIRILGRLELYGTEISDNLGGLAVRVLKGPLRIDDGTRITGNAGAGLQFDGKATLADCTVADNGGTGVFSDSSKSFTIDRCAITGNQGVDGGGLKALGRSGILRSSTISGNGATDGAGIYSRIAKFKVESNTIASNTATGTGGGIYCFPSDPATRCPTLEGNILGDNAAATGPECGGGSFISKGYNVVENTSGCTLDTDLGDQTGVDPLLGPLQDNGGPSFTHALLPGSPAITEIPFKRLCRPDQRGVLRFIPCDIGAYEVP
jgi:hypothetical protein